MNKIPWWYQGVAKMSLLTQTDGIFKLINILVL